MPMMIMMMMIMLIFLAMIVDNDENKKIMFVVDNGLITFIPLLSCKFLNSLWTEDFGSLKFLFL